MSLNWDVSAIEDFENKCYGTAEDGTQYVKPVTQTIIYATMFVMMGEIKTDKQVLEFVKRLRVYQGIFGALMKTAEGGPYYITAQEVLDHKGLVTNSSTESRAKFTKHLWGVLDKEVRFGAKE